MKDCLNIFHLQNYNDRESTNYLIVIKPFNKNFTKGEKYKNL